METSSVERLPSTDTRPLRIRDSDVIIEVIFNTVLKHLWINVRLRWIDVDLK